MHFFAIEVSPERNLASMEIRRERLNGFFTNRKSVFRKPKNGTLGVGGAGVNRRRFQNIIGVKYRRTEIPHFLRRSVKKTFSGRENK